MDGRFQNTAGGSGGGTGTACRYGEVFSRLPQPSAERKTGIARTVKGAAHCCTGENAAGHYYSENRLRTHPLPYAGCAGGGRKRPVAQDAAHCLLELKGKGWSDSALT